jgi:chemotaxis protein histidine kinase CheA
LESVTQSESYASPWTPLAAHPNFDSRITDGARMTDVPGKGAGFLEFFILEAGEYVEQLDGLLNAAGTAGPDASALQRIARALRGTATMAKIPSFAELAGGVERVGRAMREGGLAWDASLEGAVVAAIDELKALIRAARTWSAAEDQRAGVRSAELTKFAPARPPGSHTPPAPVAGATSYFATEAANIAAGLELLTAHASDSETAVNVLQRVHALRGVAGVREIGPLADALEAVEDAGRPLEAGASRLSPRAQRVLETAAAYLRITSSTLRSGGDVNTLTPARQAFDEALDAWSASGVDRERVVPIAELFYAEGGLVDAAPHPPTTASERFHIEMVSLGEHLGQVVAAARAVPDLASSPRVQRELRRALHAIEAAAVSFGERDVAAFVRSHAPTTATVDFLALNSLDDLASALAEPEAHSGPLRAKLDDVRGRHDVATAIGSGFGRETPPGSEPFSLSQSRRSTAALLDSGIAAIELISSAPLAPRASIPEDAEPLVPIESLLYRGRSALDRAVEIRDALRQSGPPTDPDALEELFDLLELARAE